MDDLHTLLRNQVPKKLRGVTGRWFVDQIKGWLEDDKGMVYWGRGDRTLIPTVCAHYADVQQLV